MAPSIKCAQVQPKFYLNLWSTFRGPPQTTLRAIARRRLYVVLPLRARVIWRFKNLAPRLFLWLLSRAYGRTLRQAK
jgi:hypothetical protein